MPTIPELPVDIWPSDLLYPETGGVVESFDLWYTTGFGWCVPTLSISRTSGRTYAVIASPPPASRAKRGTVVRIGAGPHVLVQHRVYVTRPRQQALDPYLTLRTAGQQRAGEIRDRLSSRRAQGTAERAAGHRSWRWDV